MTIQDLDLKASSRPLPLRVRKDLELVAQPSPRGMCLTIKDPIAQRYWHLGEEESFLLKSLEGPMSPRDLQAAYARRFAPQELAQSQLTAFLSNLHRQGLIVGERSGQAEAVLRRQRDWRRLAPLRGLQHVLAWRFRGLDPDRWLNRWAPRLSWIFSTWAATLFVILLASAAALAVVQWPAVEREWNLLQASFTADQILLVMATIGVVKALHELGHAVACKHFGGECHELGFLLFLGMPSLYCNVSDAWLLTAKWPRIVISAAGVLTELAIAALCAWLWWWTHPGLVHSLAFYAMVACSLNTLLLNGNPLLQYDGYYVLSDLTGTPNLRAESSASLRRLSTRVLLGVRSPSSDAGRNQFWLPLYAIASALYRCVVLAGAAWFLHGLLEPYGVQFLAWLVGGLLIAALSIEPTFELVRTLRNPAWDLDVAWRWVLPRSALAFASILFLLFVPLPASVVAPAVLEPRAARAVYVEVDGRLTWAVAPGTQVSQGQVVARLASLPLEKDLQRVCGERDAATLRLKNLRRRQRDPAAAAEIPAAEKSLADAEERYRQYRRDFDRLVIRAPRDGVVFPPEKRTAEGQSVPSWTGTPLDAENLGCELCTGELLCLIGDPRTMDAVVYIAQGDEECVQTGQTVKLFADAFPFREITGAVSIRPTTRAAEAPDELLIGGKLPFETDERGGARPRQSLFTARIELASREEPLLIGGTGLAKVTVAPRSIAGRMWRNLRQMLRDL